MGFKNPTLDWNKTYLNTISRPKIDELILEIDALERKANSLGLYPAARALNNAKNAAGWQLAGNLEKANDASKGIK